MSAIARGGAMRFQLQEPAGNLATQVIPVPVTQRQWLESQRANIKAALEQSHGKIYGKGGAAELLGLRPSTLSSRITALGIKRKAT